MKRFVGEDRWFYGGADPRMSGTKTPKGRVTEKDGVCTVTALCVRRGAPFVLLRLLISASLHLSLHKDFRGTRISGRPGGGGNLPMKKNPMVHAYNENYPAR